MALDAGLVEQALEEATQRPENLDFFLDHLTSAEWIAPLRNRGLFAQPPEQFIDDERLVRAPAWAQSRYLARVAGSAPVEVVDVIQSIETNNERVVQDFVDAALAMPVETAIELVPIVTRFVEKQGHLYYLLPRKLVELIVRFAAEEAPDASQALMQTLLAPEPPEDRDDYWRPSPRARFSDWEYDMHVRKIAAEAVPRAPETLLTILVKLLEQALKMIRSDPLEPDSDASRVWRVRIGDDSERGLHVEQSLASAVRDAAIEIRTQVLVSEARLVEMLTEFEGELYRRIAMYALAHGPEPDLAVARRFVLRVGELTTFEPSPEYRDLLRRTASSLEPEEIEALVEAIEAGPDVDRYRERAEKFGGGPPTDDEVAGYKARWQLGRFELLSDALPELARNEYERLLVEFGPAELPLSFEISAGFVGPTSPATAQELGAMNDAELVAFLRSWEPPADSFGGEPSIEGLARTFSALTEAEPERISRLAPELRELKPAYLQWMVHGFEQAVGADRPFDWSSLIELLGWIVAQPREIEGGRGDRYAEHDPGWVWTRKAIAALIEDGVRTQSDVRIPPEERDRVWEIIEAIAADPNPTEADEDRDGGSNMDPATVALNTTRPTGIRAAIAYAIWLYQDTYETDSPSEVAFFDEDAPEVGRLLNDHLRPEVDPSAAVRAVFGQFFANLFALDTSWAEANVERVFPDEDSPLREAAWGAYIIYTRPYDNVFAVMRKTYERSAELASSEGHGFRWMNRDPVLGLGDHLAAFLWRGIVDTADELLTTYWANASTEARSNLIEQLGRGASEAEVTPEIFDRLQKFWTFAKAHATTDDPQNELAGFEWWFGAPSLPVDWRLDELQNLLDEGVNPRAATFVAEELPRLASERPLKVLRVLGAIIDHEDSWFVDAWQDQIARVLRIGYSSQDEETHDLAYDTVNLLLRKGYRQFAAVVDRSAHDD